MSRDAHEIVAAWAESAGRKAEPAKPPHPKAEPAETHVSNATQPVPIGQIQLEPSRPSQRPVPTLGASFEEIQCAFRIAGMAGLLVVEASDLQTLERAYGTRVHREVSARLVERVEAHLGTVLGPDDRVVLGEHGRDEIWVLLFRAEDKERFHRRTLPALARSLSRELASAGRTLAFPYARRPLRLAVGRALVLSDPTLRADFLLRRGRDHALADAELEAQIAARRRRERFLGVVLAERVRTVFEPIVNLTSGRVHAFEALVRGAGFDRASPGELFALAAENDLLFDFDCLCRRSAFAAARSLPAGVGLFVNCLPSSIHDPALSAESLRDTFESHHIRPSDVALEIAEGESIENFTIFREVCDHLRELGFKIALDDVGTGYASLEAVTELSPDYIKVDRALVRGIDADPSRREVLLALSSIARRIGAEIVAEGIESARELSVLREIGVPFGQGFHLGRELAFEGEGS